MLASSIARGAGLPRARLCVAARGGWRVELLLFQLLRYLSSALDSLPTPQLHPWRYKYRSDLRHACNTWNCLDTFFTFVADSELPRSFVLVSEPFQAAGDARCASLAARRRLGIPGWEIAQQAEGPGEVTPMADGQGDGGHQGVAHFLFFPSRSLSRVRKPTDARCLWSLP
ncbi:hypothetical protein EV126DRAFT_413376 [Verticillium dahliae]|nr:hypothetical protein EV126DRAFT_413376 [Verticillium dahliae]